MYWIVRGFFLVILKLYMRVKVEGTENIPAGGPLIVCANHIAWLDPVLVTCSTKRLIHWMAKAEVFKFPLIGPLFHKIYVYPVDRGKPDIGAIRDSIAILKGDGVLGIFPEGHRQGDSGVLGQMQPGAALIALRSGSPVIPVAIRGRYGFMRTVTVAYGKPLTLKGSTGRAAHDMVEGAQVISDAIRALWESLAIEAVA